MKRSLPAEAETSSEKRVHADDTAETDGGDTVRRKRRKFALLLSYSGKGYLGMQRNPGFRTIEDDLLTALLHAGLMSEESCTCPQIVQFQRAARTDKGVSAARQVVSVKLPDDIPDMVTAINQHLCKQIRVMAVRRATKGFNSKSWCDSRTYSYMCPTFAFSPSMETTNSNYRITPDILDQLRTLLKRYKGTHKFHNFTARKKPEEASANRYIMDIECGNPFEREGFEWLIIKIKGQSFMLHQIRKMVGLVIAVCRGLVPGEALERAWGWQRVDIPIAPGLGLVLEEPHYDKYNKRFGSDGFHEPLEWDNLKDKIQEFREEYIDSVIIKTEISEEPMLQWLATLPLHNFSSSEHPPEHPMAASNAQSFQPKGKRRFGKKNDPGSDSEVEDIDEADLDQYRVIPAQKLSAGGSSVPNGHSTDNLEKEGTASEVKTEGADSKSKGSTSEAIHEGGDGNAKDKLKDDETNE